MKTLIVFAAVILAASALSLHEQWGNFKVKHGKVYKNIAEEIVRFEIFQQNLKTIEEHNAKYEAGLSGFWMGVNKFSDMTSDEFQAMMNKQIASKPKFEGELHVQENVSVPSGVDWRKEGAVLEVKDQGECGSCWAFSTTGALEGQNAIKNGKKISLSEQQLLDCSGSYGNGDCDTGGSMEAAFKYVKDNGIESEEDYPYQETQLRCKASSDKTVLTISQFSNVEPSTESLRQAVGSIGPISVAIYAGYSLQHYQGGILDDSCNGQLNHGVLAVGYGESPQPYWIVKNSWGQDWGEEGFFRLARRDNLCGISDDASYPDVLYN
ncbi:unnamed protein product [Phyllotreta striolata]|uniref:Uncharacterized protein n=1 Tax=Phyllotreta striolata TaxID=444603 RepID=A0A9N9TFA8_PHYSR|nr:unnamed protein product [Phyllotreta striolata]